VKPWGEDSITQFFDVADGNRRTNREKFASWYDKIARIDDSLVLAGRNLINIKPVMMGALMHRCQYALKAATGLALAGQVVECFVMLRSALEYAAYSLAIFEQPSLEEVFINRHMSDADTSVMKAKFRISEVRDAVERHDPDLAKNFDLFYQRSIDFGGHPNPHGTFSAMAMHEEGGQTIITTWAMTGDEKALAHALKSTAQVGLTVLYIFQHTLKAKFELLGIRAEIEAIRNSGGL